MFGKSKKKNITLREINNPGDYRFLGAELNTQGDLIIKGQDLGSEVESIFGFREYEWIWTIKKVNLLGLQIVIGEDGEILELLERHFSDDKAAGLQEFLQNNNIPFETWSRIGD